MANGLERTQIGVPKSNQSSAVPLGPTLTIKGSGGNNGLFGVVDRKTPAMSDGSLHGKHTGLTFRGANFDSTIDV